MSTLTRFPYAYLSDNDLELVHLTNARTGAFVSDATVSCIVTDDRTDTPVAGSSWPLFLLPVAGDPGHYRVTLPAELLVALKGTYTATVSADAGPGLRRRFLVHFVVQGEL